MRVSDWTGRSRSGLLKRTHSRARNGSDWAWSTIDREVANGKPFSASHGTNESMTLAEIVNALPSFAAPEISFQEPTIFAAEPWVPHSEACVAWSMPRGGLPAEPARRGFTRLVEVREALNILAAHEVQWPPGPAHVLAELLIATSSSSQCGATIGCFAIRHFVEAVSTCRQLIRLGWVASISSASGR